MRVCPGADLADGLLDVTVVGPLPTRSFVRTFPSVYRGEHVRSPAVTTLRARRVGVTTVGGSAPVAYADGEPVGPLPLTVEAAPGAVRVVLPLGTRVGRPVPDRGPTAPTAGHMPVRLFACVTICS